jgi:hypothetical protein
MGGVVWAEGLGGGFWAGLCAKTGETVLIASRTAKNTANRDRPARQKALFSLLVTRRMDTLAIPH